MADKVRMMCGHCGGEWNTGKPDGFTCPNCAVSLGSTAIPLRLHVAAILASGGKSNHPAGSEKWSNEFFDLANNMIVHHNSDVAKSMTQKK
jgi:hypothetical protein